MPRTLLHIFLLGICVASVACTIRVPDPSPSPLPLFTATPQPATATPSLQPPDPATLLHVLNYGISLERDAWEQFDYGNFHGDFLTSPEARTLFDFIQADLNRYYSDGVPQAGEVFTNGSLDSNIWFPPRAVWSLAQAGVVDLLRARGTSLESTQTVSISNFDLHATPVELDGDPGSEWIVEVNSTKYNLRGWLPLDEHEGQYILISNDLQHENQARAQGVTTTITPDLNGDGLADFVVHFDGQPLGTQFGYLKVYGRVREGIFLLDTLQLKPGESFEIANSEIRITIPRTLDFECSWTQTNVYRWQGEENVYSSIDAMPPDTLFCNAAVALSPLSNLTPETRATLLDNTLKNLSSELVPSEDYLVLLQIHLAMAYSAQGFDELAYQTILPVSKRDEVNFQKGDLTTSGGLINFCDFLYLQRENVPLSSLAQYFNPAAVFQAYGDSSLDVGELVCPLGMWANNRLKTLTPPATRVPDEFWPELGTAISDLIPYQLDNDPEDEWIGWLELEYTPITAVGSNRGYLAYCSIGLEA